MSNTPMPASSTATASSTSTADAPNVLKWNWQPQPAAQRVVDGLLADFLSRNSFAATLAQRMRTETGTRFKDWVDHIVAPHSDALASQLREAGFTHKPVKHAPDNYECDLGIFPAVVLDRSSKALMVVIKVDSVIDFLTAHNLPHHDSINSDNPTGDRGEAGRLRLARASSQDGPAGASELWAIERHGMSHYAFDDSTPVTRLKAIAHLDKLRTRPRHFPDDAEGFVVLNRLVDDAIRDLGRDWACDLFFEAERRYWMRRNRCAQVQYMRQCKLGLGWANHDHHTYRCSREHFPKLVALFEKLGFHCREAFYAGAEAGWGAQVMEQPVTKITTFNDVDMSPEELFQDFAHKGFTQSRDKLGTIGLWCALHGESLLQAGMHHLECQFDWHALVEQLDKDHALKFMAPFTTFPYLRQAFSEGERWSVDAGRIDRLLGKKLITPQQADLFRAEGAVGSHLENLERNDGFKGFNQKGVSDIIARTDPRKLAALTGA